jgi:N-acetylneuraminate lyase
VICGVIPALLTPFTAEEGVDVPALERLIARLYDSAEIAGLYVCGQTGEGLGQSASMRRAVVETAVRCSPPGKTVIAHVGAARTAEAVELARHAAASGVSAVSSLPPAGSYSLDEFRAYYAALAAASDVPVVVYFYPEVAPGISSGQVADLCLLPNVAGVKFTSFELHRITEIHRAGGFVLNGRDEVFAAGLLMGAAGGIGSFYNVLPKIFCQVYRAALDGRWDQARELQNRISELISIVLRYPMIPALKKMLEWSGVPCGTSLSPRRRLLPEEETSLRAALESAGFDPSAFPS